MTPTPTRGNTFTTFFTVAESGKLNITEAGGHMTSWLDWEVVYQGELHRAGGQNVMC